jgi:hypothetical protein
MIESKVIVLVGDPNVGKTKFFSKYTNSLYRWPTVSCIRNVTIYDDVPMIFYDTPGSRQLHNKFEYSWQGIFRNADVILDFGGWCEEQVFGTKGKLNPKYMTWSGDDGETMKRLHEYLQGTE